MTDADDSAPAPAAPPHAAAPLEYFEPAARRRYSLPTALAVAAVVIGVAGAIATAMAAVAMLVAPTTLWDNPGWFANQILGLLSSIALFLGGVAFLRRSRFLWNALVAFTLLTLAASGVGIAPALLEAALSAREFDTWATPFYWSHLTDSAGYALFEMMVLVVLTRRPVRQLIEDAATGDTPAVAERSR